MKWIIFFFSFLLVVAACKTKHQPTVQSTPSPKETSPQADSNYIKTTGRVSHRYSATGCGAVIVCGKIPQGDTLILIPITPLNNFDKEGLEISFGYRKLRVHQPKGCGAGIPVQITDVKQK